MQSAAVRAREGAWSMNLVVLQRPRRSWWIGVLVLVSSGLVAAASARPYAGSWNDGSRLAAVESLIDYRTFAIDQSVFVQPAAAKGPMPYPTSDPVLLKQGTLDKLYIDGHFYSDKTPVPSVIMAGIYQLWRWAGGAAARERPDRFCYLMTLATAGLAYVAAVWCIYLLCGTLGLPTLQRLALTASFALATVGSTYARHVNNHILFLGTMAALMLALARLGEKPSAGWMSCWRFAWLGTLAGLAYNLDLGTGPVLLICLAGLILYRCRQLVPLTIVIAGTLPWLIAHHLLNYWIGGTLKPYNTVPEYSAWPGCPFNPSNMTGFWRHTLGHFFEYAAALWVGKRGFLCHNLPLFVAVPALAILLRRRVREWPELLFAGGWCGGTWLLYAALSNNYSGPCCSIRWFVPFLAPGYYVLARFLKQFPWYRWDFYVFSGWGAVLAVLMWRQGPWTQHMVTWFWPIQAAAWLSWCLCRWWRRRLAARPLIENFAESYRPARAA